MNKRKEQHRVETSLNDREFERLEEYVAKLGMSQAAIMRQAFRTYDAVKNDLYILNPNHPIKELRMMAPPDYFQSERQSG